MKKETEEEKRQKKKTAKRFNIERFGTGQNNHNSAQTAKGFEGKKRGSNQR